MIRRAALGIIITLGLLMISILIHEFAHIVVALLYGAKILEINIGLFSCTIKSIVVSAESLAIIRLAGGFAQALYFVGLSRVFPKMSIVGLPVIAYTISEVLWIELLKDIFIRLTYISYVLIMGYNTYKSEGHSLSGVVNH